MRIIGGAFKSRRLKFPHHPSVRPMTDKMRETLFNILGTEVEGSEILDIFSGSGSIGLEALSRGAQRVTFIEHNRENVKIIGSNLSELGLLERAEIVCADAEGAVVELDNQPKKFNIVFLDPPYNKGLMKKLLLLLDQSGILQPLSWVVCHHSPQEEIPDTLSSLLVERSKKIGQARLSFLIKRMYS